ncbi:type IV pilus biogenesis protein PilM [Patescibacteria group bacterium]
MFEFFKKRNLTLYCTDTYVQILVLKGKKRNMRVGAYGQRNLSSGIIKNGEIMQEKQLAIEIITLLSELNIKDKNCLIALPKNHIFEHIIYMDSSLKKEAFTEKLEEEIKKIIPIPFQELKYTYSATTYGKAQAVYVVAIKKEIVAKYYEVLKSFCNLNPLVFESETSSLIRNVPIDLREDKGKILIEVLPNKTEWLILWKENIFDSNTISKTGDQDDIQIVTSDLLESIINFSNKTKRKISDIYLIGDKEKAAIIGNSLEQSVKLKPQYLSDFRINLKTKKENLSTKFKVIGGLALHEMNQKNSLNLIPKNPKKGVARGG